LSPSREERQPNEHAAATEPKATEKKTAGGRSPAGAKPAAKPHRSAGGAEETPTARTRRAAGPSPELLSEIDRVVDGHHHDPHGVLGAHTEGRSTVVRALRPGALSVHAVLGDGSRVELLHLHRGVFSGKVTKKALGSPAEYRVAARYEENAEEHLSADPYAFAPTLGELDLHLIGEGRHEELWNVLGAHPEALSTRAGEVEGTGFSVWAPDARGVRVIGGFNYWNGVGHPMRSLGSSGVWELFVPGPGEGDLYKFQV